MTRPWSANEPALLVRQPNGTIQYRAFNVDLSGINGQAVYNGTAGVDRIRGGNDNDTFWGGLGKDVIEAALEPTSRSAASGRHHHRPRWRRRALGRVPATTRSTPGPAWTS